LLATFFCTSGLEFNDWLKETSKKEDIIEEQTANGQEKMLKLKIIKKLK
jgi:hypothetical protein